MFIYSHRYSAILTYGHHSSSKTISLQSTNVFDQFMASRTVRAVVNRRTAVVRRNVSFVIWNALPMLLILRQRQVLLLLGIPLVDNISESPSSKSLVVPEVIKPQAGLLVSKCLVTAVSRLRILVHVEPWRIDNDGAKRQQRTYQPRSPSFNHRWSSFPVVAARAY